MRLNWDIAEKKDVLWVKWIHSRYIKGADFWSFTHRLDSCHYWKVMIHIRGKFRHMPPTQRYNIREGYDWLQGEPEHPKWIGLVWNKFSPPKFQHIIWLLMRGRLQTRERLSRFMTINTRCVLCDSEEETDKHLFSKCGFAQAMYKGCFTRFNFQIEHLNLDELEAGMQRIKGKKRAVFMAIWAATAYGIWRARNKKMNQGEFDLDVAINYICSYMKSYLSYKKVM
ncbi:hypothetical protein DM860_012364 [Cuscuta australis]|uniref:Reverse transcriptase zinc-binding domain-containing protein n=1 Tax=Cuscuta australis TaxID=267555 RepID=A0A328DTN2_9ASTE|nr:hypothetical protein DM860_012364 [Cuscuta australis]